MGWIRVLGLFFSFIFLFGCGGEPGGSLPDLNRPKVLGGGEGEREVNGINVRHHPWIARQEKVKGYCPAMFDDIEMTLQFHEAMEEQRKRAGQGSKEFIDDLSMLMAQIDKVQAKVPFLMPEDRYSVLNLPDISAGNRSGGFIPRLVKRVYMGETQLGFPVYLDVRRADGGKMEDVVAWHMGVLEGGAGAFHKVGKEGEIYFGRGDYPVGRDPTHGMAREDRGVYLCFREVDGGEGVKEIYYLYFDGPYIEFEKHQDEILRVR